MDKLEAIIIGEKLDGYSTFCGTTFIIRFFKTTEKKQIAIASIF